MVKKDDKLVCFYSRLCSPPASEKAALPAISFKFSRSEIAKALAITEKTGFAIKENLEIFFSKNPHLKC